MYGAAVGLGEGRQRESASLQREALTLADDAGDAALYVGLSLGAYPHFIVGAYQEAVAVYDRAIELAAGDATAGAGIILACPYANCHVFKGLALTPLGRLAEARGLFEHGRRIADEHRDIEVVGWSHMWSVWLAYFSGLPDAAIAHAQQALEIAERIGGSASHSVAWFHLGGAELMRGGWPRAIEALERSAAIARENRHSEHEAWRLALLGEAYLGLGDAERARILAAQGIELAHERGILFEETHANLALARVLLGSAGTDARAEIEMSLARALELARDTGGKAFEPLVHVELAELAHHTGNHDAAARELPRGAPPVHRDRSDRSCPAPVGTTRARAGIARAERKPKGPAASVIPMSPARIRKCGLPSSRVAFAELFDPSTDMQVYGSITDAAVQTMRELGGPVPLIVKQRGVGGFTRSSAEARPWPEGGETETVRAAR